MTDCAPEFGELFAEIDRLERAGCERCARRGRWRSELARTRRGAAIVVGALRVVLSGAPLTARPPKGTVPTDSPYRSLGLASLVRLKALRVGKGPARRLSAQRRGHCAQCDQRAAQARATRREVGRAARATAFAAVAAAMILCAFFVGVTLLVPSWGDCLAALSIPSSLGVLCGWGVLSWLAPGGRPLAWKQPMLWALGIAALAPIGLLIVMALYLD